MIKQVNRNGRLENFATVEKRLSREFKRAEKSLRHEILKVESRTENVEESQKRIEVVVNKISNQLDGFVKRVSDLDEENAANTLHTRRMVDKVNSHDKRIIVLEAKN